MTQSYVQYLNVGLGLINNTEPVTEWNIDEAIEAALLLEENVDDVQIIGFRFYDIDTANNNVLRRSGIYYLSGEVFVFPKVDQEVTNFLKNTNTDFERGQQLIKIKKPFILVYKYNEDDTIVNTEPIRAKIQARKDEERMVTLKTELLQYKNDLLQEIKNLEEAIDNSTYHTINLVELDAPENPKVLNILNDNGNFSVHIEYLRNTRLEILNLEKKLKEQA
ncbi:MAG: hypothetical protein K6G26_13780 [Lachnospiraceae bacterium]|nr:hypothetical protein [Lachnospiraceae bacterium]